ncbi:hypothetical protein HNQ56_003176 [Anaerotaenia torta]|uniref:DUF342 domain-containing protein n=1 Tax=Anaerotaenia torta TaxID=433293 RepID=UPI003D1D2698
MDSRNGFFQIVVKQDGTYLKLYAAEQGGEAVSYEEISKYLMDRNIFEYDKLAIGRALTANEEDEVRIAEALTIILDETVRVTISEDRMYAVARFYPPSDGGKLMEKDDIVSMLVRSGVKYGLNEEAIENYLKDRRYCTNYILARATLPVQGHDAAITYHFNTNLTQKPKRNEDGSVDFHQLDLISHCSKNQLLATLNPMDPGKPGIDVCGTVLRPNKVTNRVLRHGKNVFLSEDGLKMYSKVDGHVSLVDGRVFVSDSLEVAADVDASTGDIDYEGNVIVKGNVITGFSIRAKGNVEVNGVVEGAYIEAGGQIVLKRGMQGMNKGVLRANGNIITKFIENAEVVAGGYVSTESILHSKVSAKGDVMVGGKRGFVTGGEIRSATMISVKTAGSQMGTSTLLEVGIEPKILEEFRLLEKKIASMMADKERLAQALVMFRKRISSGAQLTEDKREYLKQVTQNNILLEMQIKEARKRYEDLKIDVDSNTSGVIKISDIVYPGTKIVIANVMYFIREETHHSKFVRDRADIKVIPLM